MNDNIVKNGLKSLVVLTAKTTDGMNLKFFPETIP